MSLYMSTSIDIYIYPEEKREGEKKREREKEKERRREKGRERDLPQPLFVSYIFMLLYSQCYC